MPLSTKLWLRQADRSRQTFGRFRSKIQERAMAAIRGDSSWLLRLNLPEFF